MDFLLHGNEYPVAGRTSCHRNITGHDLVEWQLRVAAGEALPVTQEQLSITGHAIEARIYAENPERFPAFHRHVTTLNFPPHAAFQNGDIRIDGGVRAGDTITPFYDPMIVKLIVARPTPAHGWCRPWVRFRA